MPRKELKYPGQIEAWLQDWGQQLKEPGSLVLIGSGGLLWHAAQRGQETPLPENSMDVDPVTTSQAVALLGYEAMTRPSVKREASLLKSAIQAPVSAWSTQTFSIREPVPQ